MTTPEPRDDWDGKGTLTAPLGHLFPDPTHPDRVKLPPPDGQWHRLDLTVDLVSNGHRFTHWRTNDDGTVSFRAAGG